MPATRADPYFSHETDSLWFCPTRTSVPLSLMNCPPSFVNQTLFRNSFIKFVFFQIFSPVLGINQPASLSVNSGVLYRGVKRPGCQFEHVCPFNAQFKNGWSCTSIHPVCLRGVQTENVSFPFLKQAVTWRAAWEGRNRLVLCVV